MLEKLEEPRGDRAQAQGLEIGKNIPFYLFFEKARNSTEIKIIKLHPIMG